MHMQTTGARRHCVHSTSRLLDPLSLLLHSQRHSTVRLPARCYECRYKAHFLSRGEPNPRPFTHVGYKRCMLAFLKLASDFRGGVRPGYSRSRILRPTPTAMRVDNGYELRTSFREPLR